MSQRFFLLCGAKGGVGTTTIALDLIGRLPGPGARVLIDADLSGRRSHAVTLGVCSELDQHRIAGPIGQTVVGENTMIELCRDYEAGLTVTPDHVEQAIRGIPEGASVIVDAPNPFAPALAPCIARACAVLVVTEPTLLGISSARSMLATLQRFGLRRDRSMLVLTEVHGPRELRKAEVERTLGCDVACELPNFRDRGFARGLDGLAQTLSRIAPIDDAALLARGLRIDSKDAPSHSIDSANAYPTTTISPNDEGTDATEIDRLKAELNEGIMSRVDFFAAARAHSDDAKLAELRAQVDDIAAAMLLERGIAAHPQAARIRREVVEEAVGFGPIESFLRDDGVSEIMVNGYRNIYVERHGQIERTAKHFADDRQVRLVIERILAPIGRRIDESSPMVDARLSDGSRVNAVIAPVTIDGPTLTIRRFGTHRLSLPDLLQMGSLTQTAFDFMTACVQARLNIVVSGGTGTGKTTLLNAISAAIPSGERIVTIEDAAELCLEQPHVVRMEARPPNLEGNGAITIRDLVRNALRMRPDRIVVGECRGGEALDMLQAMNTGHDGSLTTIHANSCRDAIARIETMVLMAGFDLPVRAIREQIAGALDLVVQLDRFVDGSRRVVSISEVVGMEGDIVTMQELLHFRQHGLDEHGSVIGNFESTGVQPICLSRFAERGIRFDLHEFQPSRLEVPVWATR